MKHRKILFLLVVPLLFACGNKGGESSSKNDGSSGSPTDTSTSSNPGTSTGSEEPPVQQESLEERFGFLDVSGVKDLSGTTVPYEILAVAMDNVKMCHQLSNDYYDWYVNYNECVYVPGLYYSECYERDTFVRTYYSNATVKIGNYSEKTLLDGVPSYGYGYDYNYYNWYEVQEGGKVKHVDYQLETPIFGDASDYIRNNESILTMSEQEISNEILNSAYSDFANYGNIPSGIYSSADEYVIGYLNENTFVYSSSRYSTSTYTSAYTNGKEIPQYQVYKKMFIAENIDGLGFAFTKSLDLYYYYYVEDVFGNAFDQPQYSDYCCSISEFSYSKVGDFVKPEVKKSNNAPLPDSSWPRLFEYDVEDDGGYKYEEYNIYDFNRREDMVIDGKTYAVFTLEDGFASINYLGDNLYYEISNYAYNQSLVLQGKDITCRGANPLRELTTAEKSYGNKPTALMAFRDSYTTIMMTLLVDLETSAISPLEVYMY